MKWKSHNQYFIIHLSEVGRKIFTGVINRVLWSLVAFLLLVAIYYTVNQMGHKQISYISNGRVHKSDEIAEEEKVFERKDRVS